jgi:hypothetical protein
VAAGASQHIAAGAIHSSSCVTLATINVRDVVDLAPSATNAI